MAFARGGAVLDGLPESMGQVSDRQKTRPEQITAYFKRKAYTKSQTEKGAEQ